MRLMATLSLLLLASCAAGAGLGAGPAVSSHLVFPVVMPGVPPVRTTVDEAATACLDWAWEFNHEVEMGGGIIRLADGFYTCTALTVGLPDAVWIVTTSEWIALLHTHIWLGPISLLDRSATLGDRFTRPGYLREPDGRVSVFECEFREEGPVVLRRCREREVRKEKAKVPGGLSDKPHVRRGSSGHETQWGGRLPGLRAGGKVWRGSSPGGPRVAPGLRAV